MNKIIVRCGKYNCYWNIGAEFRRVGNCSNKQITIGIDSNQCSKYIDNDDFDKRRPELEISRFKNLQRTVE